MSCAWYQRDGKRCFPLSKGASFAIFFFHTYPTPIYLARISLWKVYRVVNKVYDGVLRVGCY